MNAIVSIGTVTFMLFISMRLSEYGKPEVSHKAMKAETAYAENTMARYFKASLDVNIKINTAKNNPASSHIKLRMLPPLA